MLARQSLRRLVTFAVGVVLVGQAACGSEEVAPATPTEAYRRAIASFCERAVDCTNRPAGFTFTNETECAAIMLNSMGGRGAMEQLDRSVESGRVNWNLEDAAYCAEIAAAWQATATCQQLWQTRVSLNYDDPRCEDIGLGNVASGGACVASVECADDASCRSGTCEL